MIDSPRMKLGKPWFVVMLILFICLLIKIYTLLSTVTGKQPLVSVVVPVYNVGLYLEECLNSIRQQSMRSFEVIIVDDCSTDKSPFIIERFTQSDHRFRVVRHPLNRGTYMAIKTGVLAATGQYIAFLDGDDLYDTPEALKTMVKSIEKEEVDILQFTVTTFHTSNPSKRDSWDWLRVYANRLTDSETIIRVGFDDQHFAWNLWNKIYRAKLCKQACASLIDVRLLQPDDIVISFVIDYYATSFIGVHTKPLIAYRLGSGISTQPYSFKSFENTLREETIATNTIKAWLTLRNDFDRYAYIYKRLSDRTFFNSYHAFKYMDDINSPAAFQSLLEHVSHTQLLQCLWNDYRGDPINLYARIHAGLPPTKQIGTSHVIGVIFMNHNYQTLSFLQLLREIQRNTNYQFVVFIPNSSHIEKSVRSNFIYVDLPTTIDTNRSIVFSSAMKRFHFAGIIYSAPLTQVMFYDLLQMRMESIPTILVLMTAPSGLSCSISTQVQNLQLITNCRLPQLVVAPSERDANLLHALNIPSIVLPEPPIEFPTNSSIVNDSIIIIESATYHRELLPHILDALRNVSRRTPKRIKCIIHYDCNDSSIFTPSEALLDDVDRERIRIEQCYSTILPEMWDAQLLITLYPGNNTSSFSQQCRLNGIPVVDISHSTIVTLKKTISEIVIEESGTSHLRKYSKTLQNERMSQAGIWRDEIRKVFGVE